jgi:hypothetical protein
VRSFSLQDGNRIREQLLTLSDTEHKSTYCIVEATVPLQRYVATLSLKPVTDGDRTFWHWESTFATPPGQERELAQMVARDVYEAGFANLRRYLQEGGDRRGASGAPLPTALPMPSRQAVVRHYGGPDVLQPGAGEAAAPAAGEVRIRQRAIGVNYSTSTCARAGSGDAAAARRAGHGSRGHRRRRRVGRERPRARRPRRLPRPAARRVLQRAHRARGVGRAPAGGGRGRRRRGDAAEGHHRRLPPARSRPGRARHAALVHAAPGGVGLLVSSWARRLGATVLGTVSSEAKARVAREHGCEFPIVAPEHRFADAVQARCGGADVVIDGIGGAAGEENFAALARRGHWISLGQASGALQPLSADGWSRSRSPSPARWCSTTPRAPPSSARAPAASGRRSPTARSSPRRSSATPSAPPTRRTAGSSRGDDRRARADRLRISPSDPRGARRP